MSGPRLSVFFRDSLGFSGEAATVLLRTSRDTIAELVVDYGWFGAAKDTVAQRQMSRIGGAMMEELRVTCFPGAPLDMTCEVGKQWPLTLVRQDRRSCPL